jgi:hypothetical protein
MLVFLIAVLSILWPNGIFYGHLVHFVVIWYSFPPFWYVVPKKSGNPGPVLQKKEDEIGNGAKPFFPKMKAPK